MRRNLIEIGVMLAVSAALVVGAMDRHHASISPNGTGASNVANVPSSVAIDRIEPPTTR